MKAIALALILALPAYAQDAGTPLAEFKTTLLPKGAAVAEDSACMPQQGAMDFDAAYRTQQSENSQLRTAVFLSTTLGAAVTLVAVGLGIGYALKK